MPDYQHSADSYEPLIHETSQTGFWHSRRITSRTSISILLLISDGALRFVGFSTSAVARTQANLAQEMTRIINQETEILLVRPLMFSQIITLIRNRPFNIHMK